MHKQLLQFAQAVMFAEEAHRKQLYGRDPYFKHLTDVVGVLARVTRDPIILTVGILHDILEDTTTTHQELVERFGPDVADTVLLLTVPKGIGRKAAHRQVYPKLAKSEKAVMVKLADRISNVLAGGKTEMYYGEHPYFLATLHSHQHGAATQRLWSILDTVLYRKILEDERHIWEENTQQDKEKI